MFPKKVSANQGFIGCCEAHHGCDCFAIEWNASKISIFLDPLIIGKQPRNSTRESDGKRSTAVFWELEIPVESGVNHRSKSRPAIEMNTMGSPLSFTEPAIIERIPFDHSSQSLHAKSTKALGLLRILAEA